MSNVNLDSVLDSINTNLNFPSQLVDARTEVDWIDFMTRFAKLINFYNKNNNQEGDWQPFLLKDPVFLTAHISSIDVKSKIRLFITTNSIAITKVIATSTETPTQANSVEMLNPIFQQIFDVFAKMHKWSYFMENSEQDYGLKVYFQQMIRTKYAAIYWAIKELYNDLNKSIKFYGISWIDESYHKDYPAKLWTSSTDHRTFWEILGIQYPIVKNDVLELLTALKNAGNAVFGFFQIMVEKASDEYKTLSAAPTSYPDTLLIRTFFDLLKSNQADLNGLSAKHLNFYYQDILKQTKLGSQADKVYLCADLAKQDRVFKLLSGTAFNAGLDADKQPIIFETKQDQLLNPAQIKTAYTLVVQKKPDLISKLPPHLGRNSDATPLPETPIKSFFKLGFNQQNDIDQVKLDENGSVVGWNPFGNFTTENQTVKSLGISFASPLLYLLEGQRTITFTFESPNSLADLDLKNIQFYLSTQTTWFSLEGKQTISQFTKDGEIWTLTFVLSPTDPSIENFIANPDGYTAEWPLFKIIFKAFDSLAEPPIINSLKIDVLVENLRTFSLGNANGSLDPSKPFQPFGPVVPENAIFYLGNSEIFSKPVTFFTININWANLPKDFATYYYIYNAYLQGKIEPGTPLPSRLIRISSAFVSLFRKKLKETQIPPEFHFDNAAFKVSFDLLSQYQWNDFPLSRQANCVVNEQQIVCTAPLNPDLIGSDAIEMFTIVNDPSLDVNPSTVLTELSSTSLFVYNSNQTGAPPFLYDSSIQNKPLVYSENTISGYLKMTLASPQYAFGNDLYPKIVAQVALVNADLLFKPKSTTLFEPAGSGTTPAPANTINPPANSPLAPTGTAPATPNVTHASPTGQTPVNPKTVLIPAPNVPFAPMISGITASYLASDTYALDYSPQTKKLQCYHYSIFENYLVFDATQDSSNYSKTIGFPICGLTQQPHKVPMYPSLKYDAVLFLEVSNLISGSQVSVLFEVNQSAHSNREERVQLSYFYLNQFGWQNLIVLNDQTNNLKCSGIITFEVSTDIDEPHFQMPSNSNWFALTLKGNPALIGKISLVKTNGIQVERSEASLSNTLGLPQLAANQISAPMVAIPELASIIQPFASFGGKSSETDLSMNMRVANQLKIKNRPLTANDFNRIIRQNFDTIFYSKVTHDRANRMVSIYLVKKVRNEYASNAFLPRVSDCELDQISSNLKGESALHRLEIKNFDINYIKVYATVYIQPEFDINGVSMRITQALKVFLSPWITTNQEQIHIDSGVTDSEVAAFLTGFDEVSGVENISFLCSNFYDPTVNSNDHKTTHVRAENGSNLLVPSTVQALIYKKAV